MEESRNKQIYRLSLEGMTNTELSKKFKISYTRVIQIIHSEEWKILNPGHYKMWDDARRISITLSTREANFLRKKGIYSINQLTTYSAKELLKIRNLGIKSIQDIQDKLKKVGQSLEAS